VGWGGVIFFIKEKLVTCDSAPVKFISVIFKVNNRSVQGKYIAQSTLYFIYLFIFFLNSRPVSASERTGGDNISFRPPNVSKVL
jgi:hypothetical protein